MVFRQSTQCVPKIGRFDRRSGKSAKNWGQKLGHDHAVGVTRVIRRSRGRLYPSVVRDAFDADEVHCRMDWVSGCDSYADGRRSEEHTSELQSHLNLVCRLLLEK